MAKYMDHEYVSERTATVASKTNPKLLAEMRRLGYAPSSEETISKRLMEMVHGGTSPEKILLHAGWGLVADGEGLWPTTAFAKGLLNVS